MSRIYVVRLVGKNRAEWECPKGHRWVGTLIPKKRGIPLPDEQGQRFFASWWSKAKGGVIDKCPKCEKERT